MTNKERMLQMVLDDKKLQELYDYDKSDYEDFYIVDKLKAEELFKNTR